MVVIIVEINSVEGDDMIMDALAVEVVPVVNVMLVNEVVLVNSG